MEAAKPVFFHETPKEQERKIELKDIKMKEIKSFEIELTNKKFTFELAKSEDNENIILKLYCNNEKKLKYYIMMINPENFYSRNDFFKFYKTINELYTLIHITIKQNKYSINLKENLAILSLEFMMPGDKVIDESFLLQQERVKNEELMEFLKEMMDKLNEDNNLIKEDINNLKKENENLKIELKNKNEELDKFKNEINNTNDEMKKIKEENNEIKEKLKFIEENMSKKKSKRIKENIPKNEDNKIICINKNVITPRKEEKVEDINEKVEKEKENKIIEKEEKREDKKEEEKEDKKEKKEKIKKKEEENKNVNDKAIFIKKVVNIENLFNESKIIHNEEDKKLLVNWISTKGNIQEIKLIYRATDDGDESDDFFNKCSKMGPTISLIKTKKEKIFGGFTKSEWVNKNKIIADENAFLFSINNKQKYDILIPENAINCIPEKSTLIYGNNNDRYGIRLFSKFLTKNSYENMNTKVYNTPSDYCLNGNNIFVVREVEVFQVIFE